MEENMLHNSEFNLKKMHHLTFLLALLIALPLHLHAQDESPGQVGRTLTPTQDIPPEFQSARNMAILDRIP